MKEKKVIKKHIKSKLLINLGFFVLFGILFLMSLTSAQQTPLYCAERTIWGASCQMVPLNEVNVSFSYEQTSCESTAFCSVGTCVNTLTGECLPGPRATCNPSLGGYFYDRPTSEVAECKIGCCILGESTALVERVRCDAMSRDYNLNTTFMPNINDELTCSAMAGLSSKGACVFQTERGRTCTHKTRGECISENGEFHEKLLCSAAELGTNCVRTSRTTCVEGKNEVYYVDSCGNVANVYDYNKKDDLSYWTYFAGYQGVTVDVGDNQGNINSRTNGFCDYSKGSTCGKADNIRPALGEYICKDLSCPASNPLTGGVTRKHGESWCITGSGELRNIDYFENPKVGDISYLAYCYNGEVQTELCDPTRNSLCYENRTAKYASCVINRWVDCFNPEVDTVEECLDTDLRDCKLFGSLLESRSSAFSIQIPTSYGASPLRTSYGTYRWLTDAIGFSCVPKYPPGLKFWDPSGTIGNVGEISEGLTTQKSVCELGSNVCKVHYTNDFTLVFDYYIEPDKECIELCKREGRLSEDQCENECTPVCLEEGFSNDDDDVAIKRGWAIANQNLCKSLGDCGVSANYKNKEGRNMWKDLIFGNKLKFNEIPNLYSRR